MPGIAVENPWVALGRLDCLLIDCGFSNEEESVYTELISQLFIPLTHLEADLSGQPGTGHPSSRGSWPASPTVAIETEWAK